MNSFFVAASFKNGHADISARFRGGCGYTASTPLPWPIAFFVQCPPTFAYFCLYPAALNITSLYEFEPTGHLLLEHLMRVVCIPYLLQLPKVLCAVAAQGILRQICIVDEQERVIQTLAFRVCLNLKQRFRQHDSNFRVVGLQIPTHINAKPYARAYQ